MSARITIVTPATDGSQLGNRVTAERWTEHLRALGHEVVVRQHYVGGNDVDVLFALHARRSAASAEDFRAAWPDKPLIVVLTGTDLYRDIHSDAAAEKSLELATRLVVLQPRGVDELPEQHRDKVRSIVQSATRPKDPVASAKGKQVCVLGHMRAVKDPFRAAEAVRLLPEDSEVHVVQIGSALAPEFGDRAREESATNPRYRWVGEVPHAEGLRLLASSWLHVLSSEMEGGANAVCEALACDVPTLSSRISGSLGLLGEDYPGYFPVGDTEALAALLHGCETDPDFYADLQRRCRERARQVEPAQERESLRSLLAELGHG